MRNLFKTSFYIGLLLMVTFGACTKEAVREPSNETDSIRYQGSRMVQLTVSNVSLDRKGFSPSKNEKVNVKYHLSKQANIAVRIYDSKGDLIRTLDSSIPEGPGYSQKTWDGRDNSGNLLLPGIYTYTIEAEDALSRESITYEHIDTKAKRLSIDDMYLDKKEKTITYTLPQPATVTIRIGIKDGGPLLRSLLYQEPQLKGKHTINWDGWDNSKVMNLLDRQDLLIDIQASSLAQNTIFLKDTTPLLNLPEPGFDFCILNAEEFKDNGMAVVKDHAQIEVRLSEEDKEKLIQSRFEIMFFLDTQFIYEEEEPKTSPFVYTWNVQGLTQGEHILTVNILDPDDRAVASKSKRIFLQKDND